MNIPKTVVKRTQILNWYQIEVREMVKITYPDITLESEEEDKLLIEDIKENLKRGSNKELIKEGLRLVEKLS